MMKRIINFFNLIKDRKFLQRKQNGYALLFAVVITSIISIIVAGLSNLTYKQMVLTSLVKDSQQAFYTADTAIECALYGHFMNENKYGNDKVWECGSYCYDGSDCEFSLFVEEDTENEKNYKLVQPNDALKKSNPCYDFNIENTDQVDDLTKVSIKARGYNMCNPNLLRTVQREIEVFYYIPTNP